MNIREKIFHKVMLTAIIILVGNGAAQAQRNTKLDTLECHIVGFNFGLKAPSINLSRGVDMAGNVNKDATMASLYKGPYLDYGINALYKYQTNWLVTLDGNLWMGDDNLKLRTDRMSDVFTRDSIVIGSGGYDAVVTCYNRGFSVMGGVGKIFPVAPTKNPNSGIMARVNAGYMLQQTIFMQNEAVAYPIDGDYGLLYDHQRQGFLMGESVGFWYMSNHANLTNIYFELGVQQCWSHSTRDYIIDDVLNLRGPDQNKYFDLLYTFKVCWMFPLKGKQAHDIYYY